MKYKKEFIQDFKKLLDEYNYYIDYDWDEWYRIYSNNEEDIGHYDFLTLASLDNKY